MTRWQLEIVRDDIAQAQLGDLPACDLAPGEAEFVIDLVALTANNITYAALGPKTPFLGADAGYWDFFGERDEPGRLPVWGFATVTQSTVEGVAVGEQFYGYWPLASHAVLTPGSVRGTGFTEASPRRAKLPAAYNGYTRLRALGDHRDEDHDWWPIYRPLFLTGWLIADQFEDERDYGAQTVIVSGASSKTAIGFAHAMKARHDDVALIGLASARSAGFTRETGLYDRVVDYDAVDSIDVEGTVTMVDFAGNPAATRAVHNHFGDALAIDLIVGITHWDAERGATPLPGPKPVGFFAPGRMQKRSAEWGAPDFRQRTETAWLGFIADARALTAIDKRAGGEAALAAYRDAVAGKVDPRVGVLIEP
ncbi:DUF2855 family protein [Sphingomonas bacterium]|uniref:DUF2855 family protein n=1 Tax=Sphingomonas bacterium TaxID=1895847 RepID=UPI002614C25F|nr:DUF2855 family protein [Sphingomonas bacterium]MDB5677305.1 hypothetical protein [Sphingomonas bacterium]